MHHSTVVVRLLLLPLQRSLPHHSTLVGGIHGRVDTCGSDWHLGLLWTLSWDVAVNHTGINICRGKSQITKTLLIYLTLLFYLAIAKPASRSSLMTSTHGRSVSTCCSLISIPYPHTLQIFYPMWHLILAASFVSLFLCTQCLSLYLHLAVNLSNYSFCKQYQSVYLFSLYEKHIQ